MVRKKTPDGDVRNLAGTKPPLDQAQCTALHFARASITMGESGVIEIFGVATLFDQADLLQQRAVIES